MSHHITIITGGIGSGKSVVTQLLRVMGWPTYDCDSRAKWLMDHSPALRQAIIALLGAEAYEGTTLNRGFVAERIFAQAQLRDRLNAIVHPAVRDDIVRWASVQTMSRCFVETALLEQSGLDMLATDVWVVDAPVAVRINRVARRNGLTKEQIAQRIASQTVYQGHVKTYPIHNDGRIALLPQVMALLENAQQIEKRNI
ncbi:MAG: dephospho-CoA kinase [Muribaculaceae bacterium]|nr:dephospho-CoA kinase [Muribaculaceae bacterium]